MSSKLESLKDFWIHSLRRDVLNRNVTSTLYFILCTFTVILNLTELILLLRGRSLTNFQVILTSLALTDLISGIACIIGGFGIIYLLDSAHLVTVLWNIFGLMFILSILLSWLHNYVITIDRCLAVFHPFRYRTLVLKKNLLFILIFLWFVSVAFATIFINLLNSDSLIVKVIAGIVTFDGTVMIILYCLVIRKLFRASSAFTSRSSEEQQQSMFTRHMTHNEKLIAINAAAVCVLSILFSLPFAAYIITGLSKSLFLSHPFIFLHSICDPIVYFFISRFGSNRKKTSQQTLHETSQ